RDEIPFNGLEVDPDYERYTAYRLASQDPKARRFFLDYLQNNPDTPTSRVSSQVYQDSATGRLNRRDLASLHNSFESRLLNDQNPSFDEWNTANFIEREGTGGRSLGLDQDIYEGFTAAEEDLNRLRNIADLPVNLESQRRSLRERINSNFNQISRLGDPLFNPELSDQLNRINSRIPSETVPATLRDALDQNNLLNELNRNLNDFNPTSPYLRRTMAREDYASNVIPSVRKALGEQASIDAAMQDYNNYKAEMNKQNKAADNSSVAIAQRANRQAASMPPGQQRQLINRALENRGQENLSEITIEEPRDNVTGYIQKSIPGLKENLSKNLNDIRLERGKESIEELKKIIQEFPELKDLVYGVTNENPRQRVKPEAFKPYTKYADTQQRISTPADRAALYNTIITSYNDPDLKRINADTLESAEKLYVSGDPSSQETARLIIQQQGFEEQLNKIQQNSFRPQRPIVGGGGYVEPYNSLEPDVKDLVNRIDTRATKFNSALSKARSFLGSNLIEQQFPGLASSSSDLPTEAAFNFDPDTKEITPAAIGERGAYAVRVSPADPKSFLVKKLRDLYLSSGVSKNVLKFLADYPVTGTASISFDTRKPYESWADYHAIADLPKEVTDKFEQFVRGRAMAGTRPGTLVSNSPLSSSDLLDERLREGETEDTSSTVRKLAPFKEKGQILPNLRGSAYMSGGFGPVLKSGNQAAYVDLEGNVIPLQPTQAELPLRGYITKRNERFNVEQDVLPLSSTPRYFSLDPISATALGALQKGQDLTEWWNLGRNTRIPNESN
ncbi:hypothetical protein EB118_21310, partial [bacterium]|nr:hypothetical protein [bacterium]